MGLLSDPEYGAAKWVKFLKRVHGILCFLCFTLALFWFVLLSNKEFNNETYFSENALLPGLVLNEFNAEQSAKQFLNELNEELNDKYDQVPEMPVPWLVGKMSQLHLEVHIHNFTLNYPMGEGEIFSGTNVYGILRAARTPSLEALVVCAPFRFAGSHLKGTSAGIALMLAFAQFARLQKYWAKDIIFLVTEYEQLGVQAWLEAYHGIQHDTETFHSALGSFWKPGSPSLDLGKVVPGFEWAYGKKWLDAGTLKGRSGSIQAAINLEFHSPKIKYVEVKVEGLNGQLPNLDLVNLVHKLCVKSGIHHSYKNSYSWIREKEEWKAGFMTMVNMLSAQMSGVPSGNHGLFHRYGIEAVTLEGRDGSDELGPAPKVNSLPNTNFYRLGVALESIFRSLNNLLERFHQSYFFYILVATNRFVSIGQYMPCLSFLCAALLIRALHIWFSIQTDIGEPEDFNKTTKNTKKVLGKNKSQGDSNDGGEENILGENNPEESNKDKHLTSEKVLGNQQLKEKIKDEDLIAENVPEEQKLKENYQHENLTSGKVLGKGQHKEKYDDVTEETVPGEQKAQGDVVEKVSKKKWKDDEPYNIVNIAKNFLLMHLLGYAVMHSPILFSYIGAKYGYSSEWSVYWGLIILSILFIPYAPEILRLLFTTISVQELSTIYIVALIELSTVCLCVGMNNFSLGLFLGLIYTPPACALPILVEGEKRSTKLLYLRKILCLCLHPLAGWTLCAIAMAWGMFPEDSIVQRMTRGRDAAMQAVMFSVVDSVVYGNWLYSVLSTLILPIWLMMWQILNVTAAPRFDALSSK